MSGAHESPRSASTVFETERLVVRPWVAAEADRHFDMYSRDEVARFLGSVPQPLTSPDQSPDVIERWRRRACADGRFGVWAIERRDTGTVAGTALLVPIPRTGEESARQPEDGGDVEVGWHLHPDSWGRGYATEAARGAVEKGFADGLQEIVAVIYPENTASRRVCLRLDMEPTGLTRQWYGVELDSFRLRRPA